MSAEISGASVSLSSESPSFSTYSSENIADIAARVVKELNLSENDPYDDDFYSSITLNDAFQPPPLNDAVDPQNDDGEDDVEEEEGGTDSDDESEFEFAILNSSPISADEIFDNGQIKPMFPIFNTDLVYGYTNQNDAVSNHPPTTIRLPLRKLLEERENSNSNSNGTVSSSSSEADDLEGVPPGTYCVWAPKKKEEIMMKKKSKSTGSSKRWRFKDLLYTRSNSDGKDTFVFLTPSIHHKSIGVGGGDLKRREKMVKKSSGKINDYNSSNSNSNGNNNKNKKSYLPYRRDLVGFFANVNGISRTVRPF